MEKLAPLGKKLSSISVKAMTLVEVLVALAIVSFVFSSLTQMTFDALKRAKKLEMQDKMRNYATEASQVLYNKKNSNWSNFSTTLLPPATSSSDYTQGYLTYTQDQATNQTKVDIQKLALSQCRYDETEKVLVGMGCESTAPPEKSGRVIFGRLILRRDDAEERGAPNPNTANDATIDIIVACLKNQCDPKEFPPFVLNLAIYRTGGSQ